MELPFKTPRERGIAIALVALWAILFLPNLRTNPDWYGDEGVCMEMSWTAAHGQARLGALRHDFITPIPYQPLWLLLNGTVLRVFGNDILVGRALQVLTALATAAILFWMGTRLRDKNFGFLCAAGFLIYPEVVMHYRWVRMHPMAGTLALASCGFLIRYVQEKRLRDVVWAGVLCSLSYGAHPFTYTMAGIVVTTTFFVNRRHLTAAMAAAAAWGMIFLTWFVVTQGGMAHLMAQLEHARMQALGGTSPSYLAEIARVWQVFVNFAFLTPTISATGTRGVDFWLVAAMFGALLFPIPRFRKWLLFWLLVLMYGVLRSRDNVPVFFYPAMAFVPLMSIGFAGMIVLLGDAAARLFPKRAAQVRLVPLVGLLGVFGLMSATNSLGHWRSKIDTWMCHSPSDAEAAMRFVRERTTDQDFVIMPDQVYWLYPHPYRAQLVQCAHYAGIENAYYGDKTLPREQFWFDCSWQKAKYCVLAFGVDADGRSYGIDAIFWPSFKGVRKILEDMQAENWRPVFRQGEYMVLANPRFKTKEEPK